MSIFREDTFIELRKSFEIVGSERDFPRPDYKFSESVILVNVPHIIRAPKSILMHSSFL